MNPALCSILLRLCALSFSRYLALTADEHIELKGALFTFMQQIIGPGTPRTLLIEANASHLVAQVPFLCNE